MLTSELSGKPISILNELVMRATRLKALSADACDRLCFLVDEKEWDELDAEMSRLRGWHSDHADLPTLKMSVLGFEVRRR